MSRTARPETHADLGHINVSRRGELNWLLQPIVSVLVGRVWGWQVWSAVDGGLEHLHPPPRGR